VQFAGTPIAAAFPARWPRWLAVVAALTLGPLICTEKADAGLDGPLSFGGAGALVSQVVSVFDDWGAFGGVKPVYAAQPSSPGGTLVGLFSRPGLIGGFASGFLGAGLLGLVFGYGMTGGLTGVAATLGLIFQLALLVILARLIWVWWRADTAATVENLSPRQLADAYGSPRNEKLPDFGSPANAEILAETEPNSRPRPLNT